MWENYLISHKKKESHWSDESQHRNLARMKNQIYSLLFQYLYQSLFQWYIVGPEIKYNDKNKEFKWPIFTIDSRIWKKRFSLG